MVEFLLATGPRAGAMSAREIAQAVGTSDATVIRTARSLGFEGFRDLRRFVANQGGEVPIEERLRQSLDAVQDPDAELWANIDRQRGALLAMAERIPQSEFRQANQIIERASYVWWSGVGPSAFLAAYAAFLFRRLGKDSGALTHAGFDGADELLSVKGVTPSSCLPTAGCTGMSEYSSIERRRFDPRSSSLQIPCHCLPNGKSRSVC